MGLKMVSALEMAVLTTKEQSAVAGLLAQKKKRSEPWILPYETLVFTG